MRRHAGAGGRAAKQRPRTGTKLPGRSKIGISLQDQLDQSVIERNEAVEQYAAGAEVLRAIASSQGNLAPVFDTILASATRLCEAKFATLYLYDGSTFTAAAMHNGPAAYVKNRQSKSIHPAPGTALARVLKTKRPVHIPDIKKEKAYLQGAAIFRTAVRLGDYRSMISVPMVQNGKLIGAIAIQRQEVHRFTKRQIDLVSNFAAQAVIAIENTRLLKELRQRTNDLSESLEQQTATSEVLQVISSSPGELAPVFSAMLENATRICGATFGIMWLHEGDGFRVGALHNTPTAFADERRREPTIHPHAESPLGRVFRTRQVVQIADITAMQGYVEGNRPLVALAEFGGARTIVAVPMFKNDKLVGVISIYRQEVRPFNDKQVALLTGFASQAVIAIENTRLLNELHQRTDDLSKSLEQQTATSEVLSVISSSPGELEPVFQAMLENATRICDAKFGTLFRFDGELFHRVAGTGTPSALVEFQEQRGPFKPEVSDRLSRILQTKAVSHVADEMAEPNPGPACTHGGARSVVAVPMLKDNELVGAIIIYRQEVRPFTAKQIELVQNFAAQAVIAIENTRLLNELRQRTDDLTDALEQQTATSEVLQVISSSPGDLDPVFHTMLHNAVRICEAKLGNIALLDGDQLRVVSQFGAPPVFEELRRRDPFIPIGQTPLGRILETRQVLTVPDLAAVEPYASSPLVNLAGARAFIGVPLQKESKLIGVLSIYREDVRPFTNKQIELVQNFAAQAVIAIENTRLLNELRQRTDDLSEALEQQTATSEVLKVISSSPGELEPVFQTILKNATNICGAKFGTLIRIENGAPRIISKLGVPEAFAEFIKNAPQRPSPINPISRVIQTRQAVHIADYRAEQAYIERDPVTVAGVELGGMRTLLVVPMLKDNELIGAVGIYRQEVRAFTEKQIELVSSFAAQAVIAIENTRLLSELRQSLQQQTATADVLKVISRSTFDLRTVLNTLVELAARLCEADMASINREKGTAYQQVASYGYSFQFQAYMDNHPIPAGHGSIAGRTITEGRIIHIHDVLADPDYKMVDAAKISGMRTVLGIPLLREGTPIGVIVLQRKAVRPFTEKQVELVTTFADQAVIAIENVRLFESVEARTRELAKSLEDLRTAQDRLVQTEKLASLGQLTAGIAHEIKNPLNFVNNFSAISIELIDELREALAGVHLDDKLHAEISEIADMLQGNLDKVVQHGKRADSIVKNMLLHSRHGSGEHRPVDINAVVEESLNLAYHGARAEKQGFNITLQRSFDPAAGEIDLFPQEITRVLLNLISNGFYAATNRKTEANGDGDGYEPTLAATTKNLGDSVEIRIRDNGTGIPPAVREKMFNPFFTTKPAGEGTGLGLSLSYDIIVKQHAGLIEVDTEPGEFTEFRIVLPRAAATIAKSGGRA